MKAKSKSQCGSTLYEYKGSRIKTCASESILQSEIQIANNLGNFDASEIDVK